MATLVGLREFARIRGVSLAAVQKAIKSGRIDVTIDSKGKPKIDPDIAVPQWDANTDQGMQRKIEEPAEVTTGFRTSALDNQDDDFETPQVVQIATLAQSRAIRESFSAKLTQLKYEEQAGKLVEVEKVKREAFQAARLTRDTLLNLPNKISHELAAEMDPAKIHIMLTAAITKVLEELTFEGRRRAGEDESSEDSEDD